MPKTKDGRVYWRTQDGREMPIPEMDDKHLNNSISMLERRAGIRRFNQPERFGYMTVEEVATRFYPEYPALILEAKNRNLL